MNQLEITDIPLHTLRTFQKVVELGSFTAAGQRCGLTQSAVTRQIRSLEESLGVRLLERTTRRVQATPAGMELTRLSARLNADLSEAFARFKATFSEGPRRIKVGVARSVAFSYFPGFFAAYKRRHPDVVIEFVYQSGAELIRDVSEAALDLGICCARPSWPGNLIVAHQFEDDFTGILPPATSPAADDSRRLPFISLREDSETGRLIALWHHGTHPAAAASLEADSFDLIINLVSLGFGYSIVPKRALAIYGQRKPVRRFHLAPAFGRTLAVILRRDQARPQHLDDFVSEMLF
ncbi:MAG: LysR family transcriptional regulator [Verrucomicrobiales bacterium]|nr:LysR family transcriptional regulator [Verrucomicrobiales bacterium]